MDTLQSKLSSKNQTVIPRQIRHKLNLKPGDSIVWSLIKTGDHYQTLAQATPLNWTQASQGIGHHTWGDIDIPSYIQNLRAEWPH